MLIAAFTFGALVAFSAISAPANMQEPKTVPTFALQGFLVNEGGHDSDADAPVYMAETDKTRAAALIRWTAKTDGLCSVYELTKQQDDGTVHRWGPVHVEADPYPDNGIAVQADQEVKVMAVLDDEDDITSENLPLDPLHRTIGVVCVDGSGVVSYSSLHHIDPDPYPAPTT